MRDLFTFVYGDDEADDCSARRVEGRVEGGLVDEAAHQTVVVAYEQEAEAADGAHGA